MFRKGLTYLIGLFVLSVGIALTIISSLGTGAWDALNVGLSLRFGLTIGNWVIIVGVILIALNALLLTTRPEFLSLITIVLLGYFIDFWLIIVFQDVLVSGFIWQFLVLLTGIVMMGLGIATYLQAGFAVIPIDRFMFVIQKLIGVKLMLAKTIAEVIALVIAFILSGPIGIGTVAVTFLIGPLIQYFFPKVKKLVHGSPV